MFQVEDGGSEFVQNEMEVDSESVSTICRVSLHLQKYESLLQVLATESSVLFPRT